jgi:predicted transcriptional regulator
MASANGRLNVTLDDEYAAKLTRLAERTHVQEGTLARSLLSQAIDEANLVLLRAGISGAFDRATLGRGQAESGQAVPLDEL